MSVITFRISSFLKKKLEKIVKERNYRSLSEALNEAVERFVAEKVRWKDRREVYEYFRHKNKQPRGLEDVQEEEDI
ncbi:MAG: CopG family ribbon-helix-helix protein [Candidatus Lokiarchaeia archaeon]